MYKSIQTPHSPLSPIPDLCDNGIMQMESTFLLTPNNAVKFSAVGTKNRRRSFTPIQNFRSPIGFSPILTKTPCQPTSEASSEIYSTPENSTTTVLLMKQTLSAPKKITSRYHSAPKRNKNTLKVVIEKPSSKRSFDFSDIIEKHDSEFIDECNGSQSSINETSNMSICEDTYIVAQSKSHLMDETLNVELILRDIGLEKYIPKFRSEEIDMFVFSLLTENDLIELNIAREDRETIIKAVELYAE